MTRKRIHTRPAATIIVGGATPNPGGGTIQWGPDFGALNPRVRVRPSLGEMALEGNGRIALLPALDDLVVDGLTARPGAEVGITEVLPDYLAKSGARFDFFSAEVDGLGAGAGARARHDFEVDHLARAGTRTLISRTDRAYDPGGSSVTQLAAGGRSDWASIANSTGRSDGVNATLAGSALGVRAGDLRLPFSLPADDTLTITQVQLRFWVTQTEGAVAATNPEMQLRYVSAGLVMNLAFGSAFPGPSHTYNLPLLSWAELQNLQASVFATHPMGSVQASTCDAVQLLITAHKDL
jgi:hypothetical protein